MADLIGAELTAGEFCTKFSLNEQLLSQSQTPVFLQSLGCLRVPLLPEQITDRF
jgi:hypothetical protein